MAGQLCREFGLRVGERQAQNGGGQDGHRGSEEGLVHD